MKTLFPVSVYHKLQSMANIAALTYARFMLLRINADKPITVTTDRECVPEGAAARAFYQKLGFVPERMTVEFGSEVQEFLLDIKQ